MGRHGRKNRDKLRAWKNTRDPEREARMRELHRTMRDPDTGRLLRYKKYADRELLVMVGGDQSNPELVWMHYDDLAEKNANREWLSRKMAMRYGLDADLEQRCWYTGTQLYLVPWALREKLNWEVPWECSREHLVCQRNGGLGSGPSNLVIAGRYINDKLGHNPLPLKLLHRQEFAKRKFPRDNPVWEATRPWVETLIEIENQYRLGRHYPWQPWAYEPGSHEHKIAQAFHKEMRAEELAFLALDEDGRKQWLDEFVWRW